MTKEFTYLLVIVSAAKMGLYFIIPLECVTGYVPDIEVKQHISAKRNGKDEVLEKILELIMDPELQLITTLRW